MRSPRPIAVHTRMTRLCVVALVTIASTQADSAEPTSTGDRTLSQATLLGVTYCDADDDGRRGKGELGVGGVRDE